MEGWNSLPASGTTIFLAFANIYLASFTHHSWYARIMGEQGNSEQQNKNTGS